MASRNTRKQATRIAVIAFVAADCAGIAYVQHRMDRQAAAVQELAYAQALALPTAEGPAFAASLARSAATPALALTAPRAAVPAAAPEHALAPRLAIAPAAAAPKLAAAPAVPAHAAAPALALTAVPEARAAAQPLKAPRLAPVAGLGKAHLAVTVPAKSPDAASGTFANAFSLYDEAPESEHRFGQGEQGSGALADLVAPREEPAPIFDKAGIAPVTGQAATVDFPAPAEPAAADAPAEVPVTKG